ncbi:hypothetical protein DSTSK_09390 [Desulforhabdus sp. TSK]|nr:hypothetical protein DSTSK_09390 [Desulforhabdus sp. TSK]
MDQGGEFVVVGGVAAVLHGAPVTIFDLDLVHLRTSENLKLLVSARKDLDACYRGRGDQKLRPTTGHLASSGYHLLMTRLGPLDILGTIGRDHDFEAPQPHPEELRVGTMPLRVLNLETIITVKEEVGMKKTRSFCPL